MKKTKAICLLLCLALLIPVFGVSAEEAAGSGCRTLDAAVALGGSEKMVKTSNAVFVYERKSGTLIYAYDPDERIYPASMVKMMTAIVALENAQLDEICTVTRSALNSVAIGSVSAHLARWEEISMKDLLYCMMVSSANDAAAVIAEHVGGNQENFIEMMNEKAAKLGCTDTHFSNVHGLHDEQTYTTARDICRIIDAGLQNPEFEAMFKTAKYTVPATNMSEERVLHTTNYMISKEVNGKYFDARVTGGKTGATDKAGRCLAVTAEIGDMELIAIVMGAKPTYEVEGLVLSKFGSFEEMGEILNFVDETFEYRQIFQENQVLSQHNVAGGSNDVAVTPNGTVFCVLPKGAEASQLTWSYGAQLDTLRAPIEKGQVLADLNVWYNGICVGTTDLIAMNGVDEYQLYTGEDVNSDNVQEEKHGEIIAVVFGVILGIAVLILVIGLISRIVANAAKKARIRRRRRNRRRNFDA